MTFEGWIPLFLSRHNERLEVEWCYMGSERFCEPFCHHTLQKLASRPFNRMFRQRSDLETLRTRAQEHPGLPLQGIVFHMSRCGSTLAAQWLGALSDSVVLSEPEPLDTLLQWPDYDGNTEIISALLSALGQSRRTDDRRLFLKTDCWHILHIDRLLAAFPDTPWIFLYRDPVEVLVSHQRMPGWQLVPGSMAAHGLHAPDEAMNHPLSHGAWILSVILDRAAQAIQRHPNGLLLNYTELTTALESRLPEHFSILPKARSSNAESNVIGRHAKNTHIPFQPDGAEKRAAADAEIIALAERWLNKPYQVLESLRRNQE